MQSLAVVQSVTEAGAPPGGEEFEFTLLGPGYGESIVMHIGAGEWVVVDSCVYSDGTPRALRYLESIGVNPAQAIVLIVATHWHDDHIRGIARLVELCPAAKFCCASVLCREEFLALVGTLEGRHFSVSGSGLREIYEVFSRLGETQRTPKHALANRVVLQKETCTISSLSPCDEVFQKFLKSVGQLVPGQGKDKTRIQSLSPNETSVALWVDAGDFTLLLGADLEEWGWVAIVGSPERPVGKASVFKVPHHGSENADEPEVWKRMLMSDPVAVLTPWRRGGHVLPRRQDAERILAATRHAYVTDNGSLRQSPRHENSAVARTLRESRVRFRPLTFDSSSVRLRRPLAPGTEGWSVKLVGDACHLKELAT